MCVSPFLCFTMSCVSWKTARGRRCSSDDQVVAAGFPTLKVSAGPCVLPQSYMTALMFKPAARELMLHLAGTIYSRGRRATKDAGIKVRSARSGGRLRSSCPLPLLQISSRFLSPHRSLCNYANGPYGTITQQELLSPPFQSR